MSRGKCTSADTCPAGVIEDDHCLTALGLFFVCHSVLTSMVTNYKRKTSREAVSQETLDEANADLRKGLSTQQVVCKYGMDESTLRKRLKNVNMPKSKARQESQAFEQLTHSGCSKPRYEQRLMLCYLRVILGQSCAKVWKFPGSVQQRTREKAWVTTAKTCQ